MQARWLICNLGKDDNIQRLHYGVQETGRQSEIVTLGDIAKIIETNSDEKACVIPLGSIWQSSSLVKARPNWVGNYHNKEACLCSSYYSYWGKYLTQKHYFMLTLAEVIRLKDWIYSVLGKDDTIFIRPDSGEKEFNGEIVHKDRFNAWKEDTETRLSYSNTSSNLLCVVSEPVDIDREYRLVIADKKVVTGSTYRIAKHLSYEEISVEEISKGKLPVVVEFAEKVLADSPSTMPPFFVLDIAESKDGFSVLELGCLCCAGLYECDRKKIAEAVSIAAEKAYKERFGTE